MLRVITLIALLLTFPALSGLSATALALVRTGGVEACCDADGAAGPSPGLRGDFSTHQPPDTQDSRELVRSDACFGSMCPCLFCKADDLVTPPVPALPPAVAACAPGLPYPRYLSDFDSSIEYPPEAA